MGVLGLKKKGYFFLLHFSPVTFQGSKTVVDSSPFVVVEVVFVLSGVLDVVVVENKVGHFVL